MPDLRVLPATDPARYLATDELVWFAEPTLQPPQQALSQIPEDGRFAVESGGGDPTTYAGIYGVYPLTVTIPGAHESLRQVPAAGLTWVGVHPDERRRGVLTAMLRDHFERVRADSESGLSALHASEPTIYGRHGYGVASWETTLTLSRGATFTAPGLEAAAAATRTRLVRASDEGVVERSTRAALRAGADRLGSVVLPAPTVAGFVRETPQSLRDTEPRRVLFAIRDGVDVGQVWFHRTPKWEDGQPQGTVHAREMTGDPAAQLAILRRLVDLDLTSRVQLDTRGLDDEIVHWVGGPRGVHGKSFDSLWLRLVDLPKALTARGYATGCDLVLEVTDQRCEWNDGRWRLAVGDDGQARVERTEDAADLRLDTRVLASAYLGSSSLGTQLRCGLVEERRPGAVRELDAALRMSQAPVAAPGF